MRAFMILMLFGVACTDAEVSSPKIDHGFKIDDNAPFKLEAVVRIFVPDPNNPRQGGACTATAVSNNTLLTAAHCVEGSREVRISSEGPLRDLRSSKIYAHPGYKITQQSGSSRIGSVKYQLKHDVAFVVFDEAPFTKIARVGQQAVTKGDQILMVGHSPIHWDASLRKWVNTQDNSKRWGSNLIEGAASTWKETGLGSPLIRTDYGKSQKQTALDSGDSGGPMLRACELVGIASAKSPEMRAPYPGAKEEQVGKYGSLHADLTWEENVSWLKNTANDKGAAICGLNREAKDPACDLLTLTPFTPEDPKTAPCEESFTRDDSDDGDGEVYFYLAEKDGKDQILGVHFNQDVELAVICPDHDGEMSVDLCLSGSTKIVLTPKSKRRFLPPSNPIILDKSGKDLSYVLVGLRSEDDQDSIARRLNLSRP